MFDPRFHPKLLVARSFLERVRRRASGWERAQQQSRQLRAAFYDSVWQQAAANSQASATRLGGDIWRIERDGRQLYVRQNETPLDNVMAQVLAGNKAVTYKLLAERAVPIPDFLEFTLDEAQAAADFLRRAGGACVVKPCTCTGGGIGVTTGVASRRQLATAIAQAAIYGGRMLIERELAGVNYRLLFLDGVLLDAVARHKLAVTGDGRLTVAQLVERENASRLAAHDGLCQALVNIDGDMRRTLARQGLSLKSIPAAGATVTIKNVVNENSGEENVPAMAGLCPAVVAQARAAAAALGVRFAGVDVITPDAGRPLAEVGGAVIEVNTTPGFYWHYHQRGGSVPVAEHVLAVLLGGEPGAMRAVASLDEAPIAQRWPLPAGASGGTAP